MSGTTAAGDAEPKPSSEGGEDNERVRYAGFFVPDSGYPDISEDNPAIQFTWEFPKEEFHTREDGEMVKWERIHYAWFPHHPTESEAKERVPGVMAQLGFYDGIPEAEYQAKERVVTDEGDEGVVVNLNWGPRHPTIPADDEWVYLVDIGDERIGVTESELSPLYGGRDE